MRSLRTDSFRAARVGLILAIVIMFLLILWFFLARVTLYEVSSSVEFTHEGRVVALFQPGAMSRIRSGQSAILRLDAGPDRQTVTVPALVVGVEQGGEKVEMLVFITDIADQLMEGKIAGQVEIEVEQITPAELVLRTSGSVLNQSEVPLSPQTVDDLER